MIHAGKEAISLLILILLFILSQRSVGQSFQWMKGHASFDWYMPLYSGFRGAIFHVKESPLLYLRLASIAFL
jgi:hypothetical protein